MAQWPIAIPFHLSKGAKGPGARPTGWSLYLSAPQKEAPGSRAQLRADHYTF